MLPNPSPRKRRRPLIVWGIIIVSAILAFVLGIFGYAEYYATRLGTAAPPSITRLVYDSARLLVADWGSSADEKLPRAIQMARLFALVSWSAAAIKGLFTLASKRVELIRCRLHRNHAIVCGLGRQGVQLASDLIAHGIPVIVIELDRDNSQVKKLRSVGVPVLMGSAADTAMLSDAAAKHARFIFAVAGDDKVNIEIATRAFECRATLSHAGPIQRCAVHIENAEISELFSERRLFKTPTDDFDAHLFDINRLAARTLLDRYPPDRFQEVHGPDDPPATILVFGTEMLAHEVVTQIARVGHYGNKRKPIVQLITSDADPVSRSVERRRAVLSDFVELEINDTVDFELLLTNDDVLEELVSRHQPSIVYTCLSTAVGSLRLVAGLQRVGATQRAKVVVCTANRDDFTLLAPSPEERADFDFTLFDVMRETCTVENIMRERLDDLARAIHEDYVTRQTGLGYSVTTNSTLVPWRALPEVFREANRHQADYLAVKLRVLGYDPPSKMPPSDLKLTDEQLELVAELEHRRWLAGKKLAGWRYTSGPKDAAKRIAPTIVAWEALTEEEKEKDRDTARKLPRLLEMKLAIQNERANSKSDI
jgi:hypothetical protein